MPRHARSGLIFLMLAAVLTGLPLPQATAQIAAPPPAGPPPVTPPPAGNPVVRRPLITPGFSITPAPDEPAASGSRTPVQSTARPQRAAPDPVYRDIPLPQPRPVYVDGVLPPEKRPLMSLGRPALLDAEYRPNDIVLMAGTADIENLLTELDLEMLSQFHVGLLDAQLLHLRAAPDGDIAGIVTRLLADERVLGAQPNYLFALQQDAERETEAADPFLAELQYAPRQMFVDRVHAYSRGENTVVAVIDTGVDLSHNEFAGTAVFTFDALGSPGGDAEPHGTAIAGLIAAGRSMTGIAPKAQLRTARAFAEEDGRFLSDSYTIAKAIDWAVSEGAQIINMSFAGPADPLVLKLMDTLAERDVLVVAAAGNNGPGAPAAYPAAHPHAIAVTATDSGNGLYPDANRGIYITVAAPGVDVIAPAPGNSYDMTSGTSIATAHVTGVLALLISRHGDLTRQAISELIEATATDAGAPGPDPEFGLGLVDAYKAALALEEETGAEG